MSGKHGKLDGLGFKVSAHAGCRQRQRGMVDADVAFIIDFGEAVDDGFVMSRRAIDTARRTLKRMLQRLDHLADVAVIEQGGTLVTTYRADARRLRRLRDGDRLGGELGLH